MFYSHAVAGSLAKTSWKIKVIPSEATKQAGESSFKDTFLFEEKRVRMTTCETFGFTPSSYVSEEKEDGRIEWKTIQVSDKEGVANWKGVVMHTDISGTLSWSKYDGPTLSYTFSGKKIKTKKK